MKVIDKEDNYNFRPYVYIPRGIHIVLRGTVKKLARCLAMVIRLSLCWVVQAQSLLGIMVPSILPSKLRVHGGDDNL